MTKFNHITVTNVYTRFQTEHIRQIAKTLCAALNDCVLAHE
jgi:hypothetical protein